MKEPFKLFIAQPMHGLSIPDIQASRVKPLSKLVKYIKGKYDDEVGIYIIDNLHHDIPADSPRLKFLGVSIMNLADADLVYFLHGWENAKGCKVEMKACEEYGINHICEDELDNLEE